MPNAIHGVAPTAEPAMLENSVPALVPAAIPAPPAAAARSARTPAPLFFLRKERIAASTASGRAPKLATVPIT